MFYFLFNLFYILAMHGKIHGGKLDKIKPYKKQPLSTYIKMQRTDFMVTYCVLVESKN